MAIIAKYKFDKTIYADLLPEFNAEFTPDKYNTTDEEVDGIITRTIESNELPTLMRFGRVYVEGETDTDSRTDSLLEVLDMNTSGLTSCSDMFRHNKNLTSIICEWDTSNVTNMYSMFYSCNKLTSLDVSNWNTSNVTTTRSMFNKCNKLTSLDLSNFDTSEVADMSYMFQECINLTSLDMSNFNTSKVTNTTNMFNNTPLLTDIGMIYCNQSTIETIASLLPTDHNITIWIEDVDVKDLTSVEGVKFKQYAKNTEVMLTSPLLEGDKLIVKDGKLCHWHKMGMVVLDGSEDWVVSTDTDNYLDFRTFNIEKPLSGGCGICDRFEYLSNQNGYWIASEEGLTAFTDNKNNSIIFSIQKSRLSIHDINGFKQWLQANPTTVVYELAEPYYELISEDPLTISLIAESSDITNSSNIPLNMTINNKGLSTVAMSPSTTYTVAFDKDTDSEVVMNLCGNEIITTDNIVEITTPSEIDDELIFYGDGIEISNVRLLEGSVSGDSIPKESFEGLKNSFEDGYIPENLIIPSNAQVRGNGSPTMNFDNNTYTISSINGSGVICFDGAFANKTFTFSGNHTLNIDKTQNNGVGFGYISSNGKYIRVDFLTKVPQVVTLPDEVVGIWFGYTMTDIQTEVIQTISDLIFLEGDWSHLSEEDWNNLGKYKVQYKVTGKNKFDKTDFIPNKLWLENGTIGGGSDTNGASKIMSITPNTTYVCSGNGGWQQVFYFDKNKEVIDTAGSGVWQFTTPSNCYYISVTLRIAGIDTFQIEEGTEATEYEPYKEYTKTFYLNSPLLEGDTIEDINGVATHVKRYKQIVLDGGSDENWSFLQIIDGLYDYRFNISTPASMNRALPVFCDNLLGLAATKATGDREEGVIVYSHNENNSQGILFTKTYQTVDELKQWLQANPTTVVYQLASPIHEPISTESILCDSYVNGHLDVDTNIPIEKVQFKHNLLNLKYTNNQSYTVQFEADNDGFIDYCVIEQGGNTPNIQVHKGINKFTANGGNVEHPCIYISGIGFNASNISVVAADRDFGYFKGLQSSFESELVTDEADENYGKYKVECKVTGKNKFDGLLESGDININTGALKAEVSCIRTVNYIDVRNMDKITLTRFDHTYTTSFRLYDSSYNYIGNASGLGSLDTVTVDVSNVSYIKFRAITSDTTIKYQIEEGTQTTSYEPYQEYTKTIYLNSPLLKGDTIEVHNGKLCHYHKMGKVVLDGSEDWNSGTEQVTTIRYQFLLNNIKLQSNLICDKYNQINGDADSEGVSSHSFNNTLQLTLNKDKGSVKQWLQANPTTVVYELAEPYYEEIEPTQEDLIITSVKEGDLHIDTIVPISSKVTYNVNVQLLTDFEQSIVEQVQATQTTDLQSILDEEIDN